MESCPKDFPYAFMEGDYCCKTQKENIFIDYDELDHNMTAEKSLCDGALIHWSSICCQDNNYKKCPNNYKCKNGIGMIL